MKRILSVVAVAAVITGLGAGIAEAKACKDPATGKFMKCAAEATAAPATTTAAAAGGYSLDAGGRCRDAKGRMAKKGLCAGQTVTATTKAVTPADGGGSTVVKSTTTTSVTSDGPHCVKGKRCGNACISVKDVCHKP